MSIGAGRELEVTIVKARDNKSIGECLSSLCTEALYPRVLQNKQQCKTEVEYNKKSPKYFISF